MEPSETRSRPSLEARASSDSLRVPPNFPAGHGQSTSNSSRITVTPSSVRCTLSGNEFSYPDVKVDSDYLAPESGSRQQGPPIYVDTVKGERRQIEDRDYARQINVGSESDQKDEFVSIKTIDDFGFGAWAEYAKDQSPSDSTGPADAGFVNGQPPATAPDSLTGVGDTFATSPQPLKTPSAEDLNNFLFVEELGDELRNSYAKSKASNENFLPLDRLCSIVNDEVIYRLIRDVTPGSSDKDLEDKTREVAGNDNPSRGMRKITTILILIGKVESLLCFLRDDIRDADLPLKFEWSNNNRYSIMRRGDVELPGTSACFRAWRKRDMELFNVTQAIVLAPFFKIRDDEVFFYKLGDNRVVLPYTECEAMAFGGQAGIHRVKIHRAHHSFKSKESPDENPYFAVKEIYSKDRAEYREEVECLEKFSGANKGHPHLMRLLLTYHHMDKYYLVFHWANGNLRELWRSKPEPAHTLDHVRWLISQCRGIAAGLRKIHAVTTWPKEGQQNETSTDKNWGRHGDIKPENILWFAKQTDHLVISDFGLTRFHSSLSRSKVPYEQVPGVSTTYRPPEYELRKDINPRYDIWTLGCLYLEFLSWSLRKDVEMLEVFSQARLDDDRMLRPDLQEDKFFNIYLQQDTLHPDGAKSSASAKVKESVKKWMNELHLLPTCSDFFHDFLDMIELHCLVPEANDRWNCDQVCSELDRIGKMCHGDTGYCMEGRPRQNISQRTPLQTTGQLRVSVYIDDAAASILPPALDDASLPDVSAPCNTVPEISAPHEDTQNPPLVPQSSLPSHLLQNPEEISNHSSSPSITPPESEGDVDEIGAADPDRDSEEQHSENTDTPFPAPAFMHESTLVTFFPTQNSGEERNTPSSVATTPPPEMQRRRESFGSVDIMHDPKTTAPLQPEPANKESRHSNNRLGPPLEDKAKYLESQSSGEHGKGQDVPEESQNAFGQPKPEQRDTEPAAIDGSATPTPPPPRGPGLAADTPIIVGPANYIGRGEDVRDKNPSEKKPQSTQLEPPPIGQRLPRPRSRVKRCWGKLMNGFCICSCMKGELRA